MLSIKAVMGGGVEELGGLAKGVVSLRVALSIGATAAREAEVNHLRSCCGSFDDECFGAFGGFERLDLLDVWAGAA